MGLYRLVFDRVITRIDPEQAHHIAMRAISAFGKTPILPGLARRVVFSAGRVLPYHVCHIGRVVPNIVGIAAGLDKNAEAVLGLDALGFGFIEVGTITPRPQPGNDKPRLWRHLEDRTIRNRMGFNNDGVDAAVIQLRALREHRRGKDVVVGVNIGKNKWVTPEQAPQDYAICAHKLAPYADYLVINVSSPNTPGLRDLQAVSSLTEIIRAVRDHAGTTPVLVKIAPDLADEDIREICELVRREKIAGVVAANTTIGHDRGEGGLSGPILLDRTVDIVEIVRAELGQQALIIGVGGISSVADARRVLDAGADLVQIYTSFIYYGPWLVRSLARGLRRR
ncbi:quinone-dependent dihydroorotate dehydrogenase [Trueperella sp. LYQ143]|uniref:quinone-dependent dihydroorotate dehydrogenase n=1 Tax=unclassified Trueperella TaxID=2630174 RepID=UPI0039835984